MTIGGTIKKRRCCRNTNFTSAASVRYFVMVLLYIWHENIYLLKTKIMVFRNGGYLRENERWYCEGQKIDVVIAYKYMGLIVTSKLIWTAAKTKLAN